MITRFAIALAILGALSACNASTSSSDDEDTTDEDTVEETDSFPLTGSRINPSARQSIARSEVDDGSGDGTIVDPSYDADTDTFYVDNLAFDGDNEYTRVDFADASAITDVLGPFAVYENASTVTDTANGTLIYQLEHKAIYAVSASGQTEYAIVRTGGYIDYGFGGFVYKRNNGVTIPTTGQGAYSGTYAGLRDYDSEAKIEYVAGQVQIAIDFEDFNDGDGVRGQISDRRVYNTAGEDITLDDYEMETLPTLVFDVGSGVSQSNGEMTGTLRSDLESGTFYAVLSNGADNDVPAEEIVGIIVIEAEDGIGDGRETGGFMASR